MWSEAQIVARQKKPGPVMAVPEESAVSERTQKANPTDFRGWGLFFDARLTERPTDKPDNLVQFSDYWQYPKDFLAVSAEMTILGLFIFWPALTARLSSLPLATAATSNKDSRFMSTATTLRAEAEARATAKLFRTQQAKKAMNDYQSAQNARDENTARLKALRLAKEAKEAEEAAKAKDAKPAAKARAKASAKSPKA